MRQEDIFGKALKGVDIREYGSGNVGATNVARVVGKGPGIVVFIIDVLKGLVSVTLIPALVESVSPDAAGRGGLFYILLGAAAIAGHIWTCFLKFKGGKGVSTTAGVIVGLAPGIFLAGTAIWIIVFAVWKYVSLASIAAAVSLPIMAVIFKKDVDFIIFASVLCLVGVYAHRANIKRLIQGVETKIVKDKKALAVKHKLDLIASIICIPLTNKTITIIKAIVSFSKERPAMYNQLSSLTVALLITDEPQPVIVILTVTLSSE